MKLRVVAAILLVAAFAGPSAFAAAPAKKPVVPVQLTPVGKTPFPERMYVVDVSSGGAINPSRVHIVENGIGIGQIGRASCRERV